MRAWRKRPLGILQRYQRLIRAQAVMRPQWLEILEKYPPIDANGGEPWVPMPGKLKLPEDDLLKNYFEKNPGSKSKQVLNLHDQQKKPPALLFVTRQLQLMKDEGLSESEAYDRTAEEFGETKAIGTSTGKKQTVAKGAGATEENVTSLKDQFDEWMKAEDEFWRKHSQLNPNPKKNGDENKKK